MREHIVQPLDAVVILQFGRGMRNDNHHHVAICRLQRGEQLRPNTVTAIQSVLEAAGVVFISGNGGGVGIRLAKAAADSV
ncbi:hypothetical protein LUX29_12380 [Aureimonas altamirensis]|uniref:hypothetical protein n=1 Tax=Aureimonas altamirensis TaxID=370622 RepID=UPI001E3BC8F4|nr:hypothetical protein [Aureimonas altamirensis]UHD43887.1 hypothetical protein LUX29_12380 [Aureimonas altamirensis]